ncbi:hypothetical protein IPA_09195 [Ignicoccus pacificus DSM 13166]|uniref:Uncharacterized protein n=1 Tax=Ignicoccus pacificus DSM 13166 TaxID=940294 RepID=A0A977KA57_9CREN|nr:hypothetical protein IPA_09195 [Ignicoccus pacificus DSM 13166]
MSAPGGKSKELKIVARQVVTLDDIKKSKRMITVLHIVKHLGEISEKGLTHLLYEMKEKGVDLGYQFVKIGKVIGSNEVHQDILDLLYVGLMERVPGKNKLRLTSDGEEFLEKYGGIVSEDELKRILEVVDELKSTISTIEAEAEMKGRVRW